eukprot:GILJ01003560.1.p1 GENE.GILJ01003560.1~~GILJ01003560.1.p1  ORF type:complete len:831 (+),score=160.17 GILJ01003560.1:100-2592(+)
MDKYEIVRQIGKGSFGVCYLARSTETRQPCVIKTINVEELSEKDKNEARNEVRVLQMLNHPNIIAYQESFVHKGALQIVMDYADGGDLYQRIQSKTERKEQFSEDEILFWFVQICLGIHHIHEKNILHRDLKTQNIFLTRGNTVKLGDFGIARVLSAETNFAKTVVGTPYYLSPELCEDKPYHHKSDIWALGCVLYELTTLRHAFSGLNMGALILKILRGQFQAIPNQYSRELSVLIADMLRQNPDDRPSIAQILSRPFLRAKMAFIVSQLQRTPRPLQNDSPARPAGAAKSPPVSSPSKQKDWQQKKEIVNNKIQYALQQVAQSKRPTTAESVMYTELRRAEEAQRFNDKKDQFTTKIGGNRELEDDSTEPEGLRDTDRDESDLLFDEFSDDSDFEAAVADAELLSMDQLEELSASLPTSIQYEQTTDAATVLRDILAARAPDAQLVKSPAKGPASILNLNRDSLLALQKRMAARQVLHARERGEERREELQNRRQKERQAAAKAGEESKLYKKLRQEQKALQTVIQKRHEAQFKSGLKSVKPKIKIDKRVRHCHEPEILDPHGLQTESTDAQQPVITPSHARPRANRVKAEPSPPEPSRPLSKPHKAVPRISRKDLPRIKKPNDDFSVEILLPKHMEFLREKSDASADASSMSHSSSQDYMVEEDQEQELHARARIDEIEQQMAAISERLQSRPKSARRLLSQAKEEQDKQNVLCTIQNLLDTSGTEIQPSAPTSDAQEVKGVEDSVSPSGSGQQRHALLSIRIESLRAFCEEKFGADLFMQLYRYLKESNDADGSEVELARMVSADKMPFVRQINYLIFCEIQFYGS